MKIGKLINIEKMDLDSAMSAFHPALEDRIYYIFFDSPIRLLHDDIMFDLRFLYEDWK